MHPRRTVAPLIVLLSSSTLAAAIAACSGTEGGPEPLPSPRPRATAPAPSGPLVPLETQVKNVTSVALDPSDTTLDTDGKTDQSVAFTLRATFDDGHVENVAPEALQFDRPD